MIFRGQTEINLEEEESGGNNCNGGEDISHLSAEADEFRKSPEILTAPSNSLSSSDSEGSEDSEATITNEIWDPNPISLPEESSLSVLLVREEKSERERESAASEVSINEHVREEKTLLIAEEDQGGTGEESRANVIRIGGSGTEPSENGHKPSFSHPTSADPSEPKEDGEKNEKSCLNPIPSPSLPALECESEMHQRSERSVRSVLKKPGQPKKAPRSVRFNESLNLFYDAGSCSCFHEDEPQQQGYGGRGGGGGVGDYEQVSDRQTRFHEHREEHLYHHPPLDFMDTYTPTLSPPEGYKDRFFPQDDPDVTNVMRVNSVNSGPPSPPAARRKVFLKDEHQQQNGSMEEEEEEPGSTETKKQKSRLGGILKGGRLWRSNSAETGNSNNNNINNPNKVATPPLEPDIVKSTEDRHNSSSSPQPVDTPLPSVKISTGTAALRTSEQIRLVVDSGRIRKKSQKPECTSSLVEKLRWLTSLDDDDSGSESKSSLGFATWPSRNLICDKNGPINNSSNSNSNGNNKKSDAGTSTCDEFVTSSSIRHTPSGAIINEAKIKQISYTLEDIDEGLKIENELETFISEDGGRIERLRKRYSEEEDYGFSARPSVPFRLVKGIKSKFSSTNQIFAQLRNIGASPVANMEGIVQQHPEAQYENTWIDNNSLESRINSINYEFQNTPGRQPLVEDSRAHFELLRQTFEPNLNYNPTRPHSWSVNTLPNHPHPHAGLVTPPPPTLNPAGTSVGIPPPPPNSNQMMNNHHPQSLYGTLPSSSAALNNQPMAPGMVAPNQQQLYGTINRRVVPNVIGRPLFLHYGALSVEAHPNKIVYRNSNVPVPETPSPTQQPPPIRYYGPPIRYYGPPPVPPRTSNLSSASTGANTSSTDLERGIPEGATADEDGKDSQAAQVSISMNV